MGVGGYILAGSGWWWVVLDIFWLVVGGAGYILAGEGWWWMVVGGGIVYSDPFFNSIREIKRLRKEINTLLSKGM